MPYIKSAQRIRLTSSLTSLVLLLQQAPQEALDGELNYVITMLLKALYTPSYYNFNRAMGVLSCAQQEFYRAVIGPYEEVKRAENGDVRVEDLE